MEKNKVVRNKGFFFGCGLFQRKCVICIVSKFIGSVSIQYVAFLEIFEEESAQREGGMMLAWAGPISSVWLLNFNYSQGSK